MKKFLAHLTLASALMFTAVACDAAVLSIPAKGTYSVGQTFSIPVEVSTAQDAPLNAVSGILSFPNNLQAVAVDKSGIINFWVHEPTISNNSGTISFEGVALNPGFVGEHGIILTVTFKALSAGVAPLSFPSASVLANDGSGTEILTSAPSTRLTVVPAAPRPTPAAVVSPAHPASTTPITAPAATSVCTSTPAEAVPAGTAAVYKNAPVLVPMGDIGEGGLVKILGTSYPAAQVNVYIHGEKGVTYSQTARTNAYGSFEIVWDQTLPPGIYSATAQVVDPSGGRSPNSAETFFQVKESAATMVGRTILSNQFFFIVLGLLGMGALVFFFGWHAGLIAITFEPEETVPGATALTGIPSLTGRVRVRLAPKHRRHLDKTHPHLAHQKAGK